MLFILKAGSIPFTAFVAVVSFLGLQEWYAMSIPHRRPEALVASVAGGLLPVAFHAGYPVPALVLVFLVFSLLFLFRLQDISRNATDISLLCFGFLYVPLLLGHLVLIRGHAGGVAWVFFLLLVIMLQDTAAFYVGSAFGRIRLYPAVSPKKSVEGGLGGLVGAVAGALVARWTFLPQLSPADCILLPLLLGPLGQMGDLFESLLKRSFGVKDSGVIVPGHGGILDRLDSILFTAPVLLYYLLFRYGS